jgi:type IV secretion system protein VirD4
MTLDELTTLPGAKCILQLRGVRPFLSPKYNLRKHPNFKYTAEANKRNAFDVGRLVNRRMKKLNPNDQYTVYEIDATGMDTDTDEDEDILNYDDVDDPDAYI